MEVLSGEDHHGDDLRTTRHCRFARARVLVVKYFAREYDPARLGQSPEASGESMGASDCVFNLANVQVIRDTPSPTVRDLARRLLAVEAARQSATSSREHEAVRVCDKLRVCLTRFAGADGFTALLRRALALARAEVRQPAVSPPRSKVASPQAETGHITVPSLRVLLVDDNPDTVTTLALLAKESGYDVRTAHDGSAGVETALEYRPNVVLLEIGLPGINGFEVAKRLREQPALRDAVLVAITGYGAPSDRQRSLGAGFDHHLIKPGDFGKVLQILARTSAMMAP